MINFSLLWNKNEKYFPKLYSLTHSIFFFFHDEGYVQLAKKVKKQSGELNSVKMFQHIDENINSGREKKC